MSIRLSAAIKADYSSAHAALEPIDQYEFCFAVGATDDLRTLQRLIAGLTSGL